jgi:hypothetical protein
MNLIYECVPCASADRNNWIYFEKIQMSAAVFELMTPAYNRI